MRKYYVEYVLGGIIAWFLIGWGLDALFKTNFLRFVGLAVGIAGGIYMAKLRQRMDQASEDSVESDS
jgi:hypothetical protein